MALASDSATVSTLITIPSASARNTPISPIQRADLKLLVVNARNGPTVHDRDAIAFETRTGTSMEACRHVRRFEASGSAR